MEKSRVCTFPPRTRTDQCSCQWKQQLDAPGQLLPEYFGRAVEVVGMFIAGFAQPAIEPKYWSATSAPGGCTKSRALEAEFQICGQVGRSQLTAIARFNFRAVV